MFHLTEADKDGSIRSELGDKTMEVEYLMYTSSQVPKELTQKSHTIEPVRYNPYPYENPVKPEYYKPPYMPPLDSEFIRSIIPPYQPPPPAYSPYLYPPNISPRATYPPPDYSYNPYVPSFTPPKLYPAPYSEPPKYVPDPISPYQQESLPLTPTPQHDLRKEEIEDKFDVVWCGFLTRSKQHRLGVDAYLISGEVKEYLVDHGLNISHKTSLEEAAKASPAVVGVVAFIAQNETQNSTFDNYLEYFGSKGKVSLHLRKLGGINSFER